MRIVHIFWGLAFGGVETMLVNIANEQAKAKAEVSIIIINDSYEQTLIDSFAPEVEVILMGRKVGSKDLGFLWRFNRELKRINPDAIHLHDSAIFDIIFSRELSRVACTTLHALPSGMVRRGGFATHIMPLLAFMLRNGNVTSINRIPHIFAISEAVKRELKEQYGVESTVVCNGIMAHRFLVRPKGKSASRPLRIIMVSRLEHDKKGQDLLIEAAAELYGEVDVTFVGIGSSMDYLKQLTHEKQMEQYVHFLGKRTQDEIATHLCDYDLFCQPSRHEGFGLTVAEAMAAGLPTIVSAGQGPAEVTCGNLYGWTFENGSVKDLVKVLRSIIADYPTALAKATEARRHVLNTYDVSVTARRYLDEYRKF